MSDRKELPEAPLDPVEEGIIVIETVPNDEAPAEEEAKPEE